MEIQSLMCPGIAIFVRRSVRKFLIDCISHSGYPFVCMIYSRRSWDTLSNAPLRLRLSMETTHLGRARHAVWTHPVSSSSAERVKCCFRAPIWFHSSRLWSSATYVIWLVRTFLISLANVFSSVIGLYLFSIV